MSQTQHEHLGRPGGEDGPGPLTAAAAAPQARDSSLDDFLDEIDRLIEPSAQDFVAGFVQKGGQ